MAASMLAATFLKDDTHKSISVNSHSFLRHVAGTTTTTITMILSEGVTCQATPPRKSSAGSF